MTRRAALGATADGFGPSEPFDLQRTDPEVETLEVELVLGAEGGSLRGRVTSTSGVPVGGALVAVGESHQWDTHRDGSRVIHWNARTAVADAAGRYRFDCLAVGSHPITVFSEDHPLKVAEVEITAGGAQVLDFELDRSWQVNGVVRNDQGEPIGGATVLALDEPFDDPFPTQGPTDRGAPFPRPATKSAADGSYELHGLAQGTVHLYAEKGTSIWGDGDYKGTDQATLESEMGKELLWDPVISMGARIRGRITYADGNPLGNVFVSARVPDTDINRTTHAEKDGMFSIPELENRAYTVSVQLWDAPEDAKPLEKLEVWPSEEELVMTASYSKVIEEKGTARVRLVDSAKRLKGGGSVQFSHGNGAYYTDEEDGVFSTRMPPGRYRPQVLEGDKVLGLGEWFDLAPGEDRDVGEVHTQEACLLVVTVDRTAAFLGKRVFVKVQAHPDGRRRQPTLDEDKDELAIEDLFEGEYVLTVSCVGSALERRRITLMPGAPSRESVHPAHRRQLRL